MGNQEQRWLTLDMLCTSLRLTKPTIYALLKKGCLVRIGKPGSYRYLDPTPEYAEQLRIAATLHMKAFAIPTTLSAKCLLTAGEIGELLGGKTPQQVNHWTAKHKVPNYRVKRNLFLYTVADVREALWRREGRILSKQRSPFLIAEVVEYVRRLHAAETEVMPTDKEFRQDDILRKKLERLADLGEDAKADFAAKVELARRLVQILESAK